MRTIYNGVDLMPIETHHFDWEPVYDDSGVDYLYTRVSMAMRALVNGLSSVVPVANGPPMNYGFLNEGILNRGLPSFRSAIERAPPNGDNTTNTPMGMDRALPSRLRRIILNPISPLGAGNANTSEITHQAIRHRLSTPRGQLYIFWGRGMESGVPPVGTPLRPGPIPQVARLFLESPILGARGVGDPPTPHRVTDCKNGPIPKILSVPQVHGDAQTMILDWAVETFVNESEDNDVKGLGQVGAGGGPPGAGRGLLSNRFSQSHSVDEHGYTTITTEGVALFRTDFLFQRPADGGLTSPDAKRPFLFMPIPLGFTRQVDYVRGNEDATGVRYRYHDTQVHQNFVAGPFTKAGSISVAHTQSIATEADLVGEGLQAYERLLSIRANRSIGKDDRREDPGGGRPRGRRVPGRFRRVAGRPPGPPAE